MSRTLAVPVQQIAQQIERLARVLVRALYRIDRALEAVDRAAILPGRPIDAPDFIRLEARLRLSLLGL